MLKKSGVLAAVLKANLKPSNEDSVVTEEVGKTADAVVEIERLKQENLDLMDIHALEQDLALIEQEGEAVGELSEATDEITEMRAEIESYYEKGGMSANDAHHIGKRLEYINKRLGGGLSINIPSTESFRGNDADRMTLTASVEASIGEKISEMWKAFVKMLKGLFEKIKKFFGFGKEKAKDAEDKLNKAEEENKSKDGEGVLMLPAPAAAAAAGTEKSTDIVASGGENKEEESSAPAAKPEMGPKIIDGIEKLAESTTAFLKGVDFKGMIDYAKSVQDKAVDKVDNKKAIFDENTPKALGLIAKSYTGKDLPSASGNKWEVQSDTLFGGYVIKMVAESTNSNNVYKVPALSSSLSQITLDGSEIKKIAVGNVECKAYAKAAKVLAGQMSAVRNVFENNEAALAEYIQMVEMIEKEAADKQANYANMVVDFVKFIGKALQDHPVKKYCTKAIEQAVSYSSSFNAK